MYLTHYAFDGDPDVLERGRQAVFDGLPPEMVLLNVVVRRADGIDIYDACPDEQTAREFAGSPEFLSALDGAGLPRPRVTGLGDVIQVMHPAAIPG